MNRRREKVVQLDRDHGFPTPTPEKPDFVRMFYAARRIIVQAVKRNG